MANIFSFFYILWILISFVLWLSAIGYIILDSDVVRVHRNDKNIQTQLNI